MRNSLRAVNLKWIDGVKRHDYKGAFGIAATVDDLFAFDAPTGVVGDHQCALVADACLLDDSTRDFLQQHNPLALRGIGAPPDGRESAVFGGRQNTALLIQRI